MLFVDDPLPCAPVGVSPSDTVQLGLPGPMIVHDGVPAPLVGVTPFVGPVTGATKVTSEPSAAVVGLP